MWACLFTCNCQPTDDVANDNKVMDRLWDLEMYCDMYEFCGNFKVHIIHYWLSCRQENLSQVTIGICGLHPTIPSWFVTFYCDPHS